jgi:DNA-binding winged helix-turn-helix (wHTH) protein
MSAVAQRTERTLNGLLRVRLAVVRAAVDEVERSLNELHQTSESSVGQELEEDLAYLARLVGRSLVRQASAVNGGNPKVPPPSDGRSSLLALEASVGASRRREDRVLSFAGFRLDLSEERLWKDDREVRLRRKPYAILSHLVGHPHRLVTHSELVEAIWGKSALSGSLVRTHVSAVRRAIGYRLIETVQGRGYRFMAEVDRGDGRPLSSLAVETPGGRVEHESLLASVGQRILAPAGGVDRSLHHGREGGLRADHVDGHHAAAR